jgi:hypothetical protein
VYEESGSVKLVMIDAAAVADAYDDRGGGVEVLSKRPMTDSCSRKCVHIWGRCCGGDGVLSYSEYP